MRGVYSLDELHFNVYKCLYLNDLEKIIKRIGKVDYMSLTVLTMLIRSKFLSLFVNLNSRKNKQRSKRSTDCDMR